MRKTAAREQSLSFPGKMAAGWKASCIRSAGRGDGYRPNGGLVMDKAGNFYGVLTRGPAPFTGGAIYQLTSDGHGNWSSKILKSFGGIVLPSGAVTLDATGNLYGVLQFGAGPGCRRGCGVVFELSPPAKKAKKWKYSVLYSFLGPTLGDGQTPNGDLVFDASGNLYGTTQRGGTNNHGTVFELSPGANGWTEKVLHSFGGSPSDGWQPSAGIIFDAAGNLYGTTFTGGSSVGNVFELSPNGGSWIENVLYSFAEPNEGQAPWARVTLHNGSLYGTTSNGGAQQGNVGVVFELTLSGGIWTENVLHSFSGPPSDGWEPTSAVIFDQSGNLYGVANGGAFGSYGYGIVYEISQ
jgi:uncharacterized repeat protein (TIGR03803 family)